MNQTQIKQVYDWLKCGSTGMSSETIAYTFLSKGSPITINIPHDSGDFGRCYYFLKKHPFIKVSIMKKLGKDWLLFVENWPALSRAYKKEDYKKVNQIIDTIKIHSGKYNSEQIALMHLPKIKGIKYPKKSPVKKAKKAATKRK